jgi:hypothetical protein
MHPVASSLPENFDHFAVFRVRPVILLVGDLAGKDRMKRMEKSVISIFVVDPLCIYTYIYSTVINKPQTDTEEVQFATCHSISEIHLFGACYIYIFIIYNYIILHKNDIYIYI